uniref:G-protein coupled receptors family 2 profile 2 domain-containing protein n=1 Tax=Octopus bimaculoides TaxID=37653 RepID=A0A0L8GEB4_OCTBM
MLSFFAFGEAAEVFNYLFAIFNTLQGMFIFIFYCIYKKNIRDIIYPYVCKQKPQTLREVPKNIKASSFGKEAGDETAETDL